MTNNVSAKSLFKNSVVISIDTNRLKLMRMFFQREGITTFPHIIDGNVDMNLLPYQRCTKSHISAVEYAKKRNMPYVLIFEDDAYPCIDCFKHLDAYAKSIPNDAQLIVFGFCKINNDQKLVEQFNKLTSKINGAHAYMLDKSIYDMHIEHLSQNDAKADEAFNNRQYRSYIIDKPFFIQFNMTKSMHNYRMYAYDGKSNLDPLKGFRQYV